MPCIGPGPMPTQRRTSAGPLYAGGRAASRRITHELHPQGGPRPRWAARFSRSRARSSNEVRANAICLPASIATLPSVSPAAPGRWRVQCGVESPCYGLPIRPHAAFQFFARAHVHFLANRQSDRCAPLANLTQPRPLTLFFCCYNDILVSLVACFTLLALRALRALLDHFCVCIRRLVSLCLLPQLLRIASCFCLPLEKNKNRFLLACRLSLSSLSSALNLC